MSSLFPGYSSDVPSTSNAAPEEDEETKGSFLSFRIAKAAEEKERKKEREKMKEELARKRDKVATRSFNLGDSSDDDDPMAVYVEDVDDESVRDIVEKQNQKKREEYELYERQSANKRKREQAKYERASATPNVKIKPSDDEYRRSKKKHKKRSKRSSSSSDDSSDPRRKKKKAKKEKDEYIEPEKPKPIFKKRWRFLPTIGLNRNDPDTYLVDDRKGDPLNSQRVNLPSSDQAKYHQQFTWLLGGSNKMNKLFCSTKAALRGMRVLDRPLKLSADPESRFLRIPLERGTNVKLSTVRCDHQIELSLEPTEEVLAERRERTERNKMAAIMSDPTKKEAYERTMLHQMQLEQRQLNSKLDKDKQNEEMWKQFLCLEDKIGALEKRENSVATIERKECIVSTAMKALPRSTFLIIELMKCKKAKNASREEMSKEWKTLMNRMPNSIALWACQVEEMRHDSRLFTRQDWMDLVSRAASELRGIVMGTMKSHKPEPFTLKFLIDLLVARVRMDVAMGYVEKAISTVQVSLEHNIFVPALPQMAEYRPFEEIWESNLPLVGEPNGMGFFMYRRDMDASPSAEWQQEIKKDAEKYFGEELIELGRAAQTEHEMTIFARHERIHEKYHWRPVRAEAAGDSEEEPDRQVELAELPRNFYDARMHLLLAVGMLKELGAIFYSVTLPTSFGDPSGQELQLPCGFEDPTGVLLHSMGLLQPALHRVPSGLPQFLDRMLSQLVMDDVMRGWVYAIPMTLARIRTAAWFIAQRDSPFVLKDAMMELQSVAENAARTWQMKVEQTNSEIYSLLFAFSTYETLNLLEANLDGMDARTRAQSIKFLIKSIVNKALAFSKKKPLNKIEGSLCRSVVLVLAALLVRLPGDFEERKLRVMLVVLGLGAKTEWLPIPEMKQAHSIVEEIRLSTEPRSNSIIGNYIFAFFGPDQVLAAVIDLLFTLADASKTADPVPAKIKKDIFKKVCTEYPPFWEPFFVYFVYILKPAKLAHNTLYRNALNDPTGRHNPFIVREFIDCSQNLLEEVAVFAKLKKKAEQEPCLFNSLARLYAHRAQFTRVVAGAEMLSDLTIAKRIVKVFSEEAKRHGDPLLWRYTLHLTAQFRDRKLGEETFTQAFADCSWSRDLHLDYIEAFPEGEAQLLLMTEKHVRTRGDPALVQTFIDLAKKKDSAE